MTQTASVREQAWRAVQDRWLQSRDELNALYLKMLPLRRQLAKNAGLPDYRAYMWRALKRFDYTPEDSLAFGKAIETEVVPLAQRLLETRRQASGRGHAAPLGFERGPGGPRRRCIPLPMSPNWKKARPACLPRWTRPWAQTLRSSGTAI